MKKFGCDQIESINFAEDKLNVAKMTISVFDRVEKIVGKVENAGYSVFSVFLGVFQSHLLQGH